MSEVMDHGVIGMPFDLAMSDELSRKQFYERAQAVLFERDQLRAQAEALHQIGHALGLPSGSDITLCALPAVEALRKDAERWQAFISCARIKFFGWAGYTNPDPNGNDPGNYRHFGAEFWSMYDAPTENPDKAREILIGFADAAMAAKEGV